MQLLMNLKLNSRIQGGNHSLLFSKLGIDRIRTHGFSVGIEIP